MVNMTDCEYRRAGLFQLRVGASSAGRTLRLSGVQNRAALVEKMGIQAAHRLASALSSVRPATFNVIPLTRDGRSWLLHAERWWPLDFETTAALWEAQPTNPTVGVIMGKHVEFPRRTSAFGVDYKYTGQTQRAGPLEDAPNAIQEVWRVMREVEELEGHNAALVNWYDASLGHYMGAHSDDERELVPCAPVVSLSWCTRDHYRRFRFTRRKGVEDAVLPELGMGPGVIRVENGCLVVMGGTCQRTHKHELMKATKQPAECGGRRINLTLRAFVETARSSGKRTVVSPNREQQSRLSMADLAVGPAPDEEEEHPQVESGSYEPDAEQQLKKRARTHQTEAN
jgi:alkylated DNA repair dioxygenase AlkB